MRRVSQWYDLDKQYSSKNDRPTVPKKQYVANTKQSISGSSNESRHNEVKVGDTVEIDIIEESAKTNANSLSDGNTEYVTCGGVGDCKIGLLNLFYCISLK